MSRRTASSSVQIQPQIRDVVMGPPPVPSLALNDPRLKEPNEQVASKYSRLKRKYYELQSKYDDVLEELARSGERNLKIIEERRQLYDRLEDIRTGSLPNNNGNAPPPKSLLPPTERVSFIQNLQQAQAEFAAHTDAGVDPMYTSRHAGPAVRKQQQQDAAELARQRRRAEEEAGAGRGAKGKRKARAASAAGSASAAGGGGGAKGKDKTGSGGGAPPGGGAPDVPFAYTPLRAQQPQQQQPPPSQQPQPQQQARIRLRPPVPPEEEDAPEGYYQGRPIAPAYAAGSPPEPYVSAYRREGGSYAYPEEVESGALTPRTTKPKRLKAHTVTTKSYSIPTIPRDKYGKPVLPLNVGIMQVHNLGQICMKEHFHTERYIFPVGYEVSRRYLSTIDPNAEVLYHCVILDGGDGPKFRITSSDVPNKPIVAGTATGAWSVVVRAANHVRNRQHSNSVSGPDFFGLGQNTIKHLIQELHGADKLKDYVWQNFVEGGPLGGRHAAVVPALPEEYDNGPGQAYPPPDERWPADQQQPYNPQQQQQQQQQPAPGGGDPAAYPPDYDPREADPAQGTRRRRRSKASAPTTQQEEAQQEGWRDASAGGRYRAGASPGPTLPPLPPPPSGPSPHQSVPAGFASIMNAYEPSVGA